MWPVGQSLLAASKPALHCCAPAVYHVAAPVAFALCTIAVAAGIGGGALYMPIYYITTKDAHIAVPLAKVTTNGVGWSGFVFNLWRGHPKRDGPLIDYDVALILEPLTLLGTIAGVLLNVFLTSTEVLLMLVVLLSYTAYKTVRKGMEQKAAEDVERSRAQAEPREGVELASLSAAASPSGPRRSNVAMALGNVSAGPSQLPRVAGSRRTAAGSGGGEEIRQRVPWWKVVLATLLWLSHAAILLASGGPLKMACGGLYEGTLIALDAVLLCGFTLAWGLRMARLERLGGEASVSHHAGHTFDPGRTALFAILSGLSGVAAGALGIAGGLLQGPLMIGWGLLPQAATATAIFMTVFTSGSTILQFAMLGRLQLRPSLVFWLVGFCGGLLGSQVVARLLRRLGRQSFVSLFLGLLVFLSMLSMSAVDILQMAGWLPEEASRNLREACEDASPLKLSS